MGLVIALLIPTRGYLEQRSELRAQQVALGREMAERDRIAAQLRLLASNPEVLETRARRFGMIRPGERTWRLALPAPSAVADALAGGNGG